MSPTASDGLPTAQRRIALLAIFIGINLTVLDSNITNVALPTIARDFQVSPSSSIWIVNGYQLAVISCLLPSASLGGILGYRKVYLSGLTLFVLASVACTLARSLEVLTIARFIQGIGAAGVMSVNQALIRESVPASRLGRAIGLNAMVIALASTAGPSLASFVLTIAEWPWLFAINLPIGLLAIVLGARALPESEIVD